MCYGALGVSRTTSLLLHPHSPLALLPFILRVTGVLQLLWLH